jgi:hypothetical protein
MAPAGSQPREGDPRSCGLRFGASRDTGCLWDEGLLALWSLGERPESSGSRRMELEDGYELAQRRWSPWEKDAKERV